LALVEAVEDLRALPNPGMAAVGVVHWVRQSLAWVVEGALLTGHRYQASAAAVEERNRRRQAPAAILERV